MREHFDRLIDRINAHEVTALAQGPPQTVLYPGDVISLAGVALIFGQDSPPPRPDLANTSPLDLEPGMNERPTAVIDRNNQNTVDLSPDKKKTNEDPFDR